MDLEGRLAIVEAKLREHECLLRNLSEQCRVKEDAVYDALQQVLSVLTHQQRHMSGVITGVIFVFFLVELVFHY